MILICVIFSCWKSKEKSKEIKYREKKLKTVEYNNYTYARVFSSSYKQWNRNIKIGVHFIFFFIFRDKHPTIYYIFLSFLVQWSLNALGVISLYTFFLNVDFLKNKSIFLFICVIVIEQSILNWRLWKQIFSVVSVEQKLE